MMELRMPVSDVQLLLYRQWQEGQLLDNEERTALRPQPPTENRDGTFAQVLKRATDSAAS